MARRDPETDPAAFLGDELRRGRVAAGFSTHQALASTLGFDRTVVTKAETGDRAPSVEVLGAWIDACRLPREMFLRMGVLARRADGPVPTWFEDWLRAEAEAQFLRLWSPMVIPGLLQTADYARRLFLVEQTDTSDQAIDALVAARLERQAILDRADPPEVVALLDEAALHRLVGTPQIVHDALIHLAELSKRANIAVQVVPASNGENPGFGGGFGIASGESMPETLQTDGVEDQTTEKRSVLRKAAVTFDRLRGDALPRNASRELILKVAEEVWKS
jgi:hypothetical protein